MLKHRTRRPVLSPRPSHARPAHVCSQVLSVLRRCIEGSCCLCTRPPRGPRCRCGCDAPSNESCVPRTAQLHARTRQRPPATWVASGWAAQISSNPPPDGRAWEDGWPVSAIPKLAIRSGRGLGRRGIPTPQAALARARVGRVRCALPAWISVYGLPPPLCTGRWHLSACSFPWAATSLARPVQITIGRRSTSASCSSLVEEVRPASSARGRRCRWTGQPRPANRDVRAFNRTS